MTDKAFILVAFFEMLQVDENKSSYSLVLIFKN